MNLSTYIAQHSIDAIDWKADKLLTNIESLVLRGDRIAELAATIALIPKPLVRDEYIKRIGKNHDIKYQVFKQAVDEAGKVTLRKEKIKATVRKNEVRKLEGEPEKWRFFEEVTKKIKDSLGEEQEVFSRLVIDEEKYIELLSSFGFTRYETLSPTDGQAVRSTTQDDFQFVKLEENIIRSVSRNQIIDFIEEFIRTQYKFTEAGYHHTDSNKLLNHFYRQMNKLFHKDLFARVRTAKPIVINRDTHDQTFFYYQNGFMEVDKNGYRFRNYDTMDGSVWESQMKAFSLSTPTDLTQATLEDCGMFADFMWKISGESQERFKALLTVTGYLCHDYYQYKLKAVNITDSSLSEASEGRTGKTLWAKMLGNVKALTEINGKDFDTGNQRKYEKADLGTQIIHLNDLKTRGRNKFDFEDVFNDITEGYEVRKLYESPFRHQSKFIFSSNKTLNIQGASQRDRILEYEWSPFFGEHLSPEQHYQCWFGRDWNDAEWQRFHNFMALCSHSFHKYGLQTPEAINLGERKLINHTAPEFLDFMADVAESLKTKGKPWDGYNLSSYNEPVKDKLSIELSEFAFDKKQLFGRFMVVTKNENVKVHPFDWLSPRKFHEWCVQYATLRLNIKTPRDWRSGGVGYIQFIETNVSEK